MYNEDDTMSSDYLGPNYQGNINYVRRHPYSSTIVPGDPDLTRGDKDQGKQVPTSKTIAWSLADDAVFVIAYALLHGHIKSGKPFSKIVGNIPGWAKNVTSIFTGSDFEAGSSYVPRPGSPGWSGAFSILEGNCIKGLVGAAVLATSLMFGGQAKADIVDSSNVLKGFINQVEMQYDKDPVIRANATNDSMKQPSMNLDYSSTISK